MRIKNQNLRNIKQHMTKPPFLKCHINKVTLPLYKSSKQNTLEKDRGFHQDIPDVSLSSANCLNRTFLSLYICALTNKGANLCSMHFLNQSLSAQAGNLLACPGYVTSGLIVIRKGQQKHFSRKARYIMCHPQYIHLKTI